MMPIVNLEISRTLSFFDVSRRELFTLGEIISILRLVCKDWNALILAYHFPIEKLSSIDFATLVLRIQALKSSSMLKSKVLSSSLALSYAEWIQNISDFSSKSRCKVLAKYKINSLHTVQKSCLKTPLGAYALSSNLITSKLRQLSPQLI